MKRVFAVLCLCGCLLFALPVQAAEGAADDGFTQIWDRAGLEAMAEDPNGSYRLMAHIDMGDAPWQPLPFNGHFDGAGFSLYNLSIQQADPQTAVSVDGNRKPYDTVFAALFSRCEGAVIENLSLLGVDVALETEQNAYAAALVGWGADVRITNCSVSGRVALTMPNRMCGVAGVMGFGYGVISDCTAEVELVLVDTNAEENCEEFMGGMLASGYADIENCTVKLAAYTAVHGYVHNGGVVGMYYVHTEDTGHAGYVRGNTVDADIHFFEHVASRRAYSAPVIGEQMHWILEIADNTVQHFESIESTDYSTPLLPEACEAPVYEETVEPPDCESFGFTRYACTGCGRSYTGRYTAPAHTPGEWDTVAAAAVGQNGLREQHCMLCGALVAQEDIIPAAACTLSHSELALEPGESARLEATLQPENVSAPGLVFASSDEGVATVDEAGLVTAHKAGAAAITCTSADGFAAAACALTVNAPPAGTLWLYLVVGAVVLLLLLAVVVLVRRKQKRQARRNARRNVYTRK